MIRKKTLIGIFNILKDVLEPNKSFVDYTFFPYL